MHDAFPAWINAVPRWFRDTISLKAMFSARQRRFGEGENHPVRGFHTFIG
jgi:hypothetical protein